MHFSRSEPDLSATAGRVDAQGDREPTFAPSRPRGGRVMTLACAVLLLLSGGLAHAAEDYNIVIDGNAYDIGLDQEKTLTLPNGASLTIRISLKDYIEFESDFFAFTHKSVYKPSKTDLGDGIYQTIVTTPLGTLILIQEYAAMDPTALVDLMLRELTKEEVEYGFAYQERPVDRMAGDTVLRGKEAVTTY